MTFITTPCRVLQTEYDRQAVKVKRFQNNLVYSKTTYFSVMIQVIV